MILKAVMTLLMTHSAPNAVSVHELAPEIVRVARVYNISAIELTKLVLVESIGVATARNARTGDYGIMQLSPRTVLAYNISQKCVHDWRCNLAQGAALVAEMRRSRHYRPCVYNVGATGLKSRPSACAAYELKLANL